MMNAFPSLDPDPDMAKLTSIPGSPPDLIDPGSSCRFIARCPFSTEECEEEPMRYEVQDGYESKCHYIDSRHRFRRLSSDREV